MGKYMRKGKAVGGMEVSQSSLGVRTRARVLALEKDQKLRVVRAGSFKPQQGLYENEPDYLELRSRKLEKLSCPASRDEGSHGRKAASEGRPTQVGNSEAYHGSSSRLMFSQESRKTLSHPPPASLQPSIKASPASSICRPSSAQRAPVVVAAGVSTSRSSSVSISQEPPRGILTRNKRRQESRAACCEDMDVDMEVLGMGLGASGDGGGNMEVEAPFGGNAMDCDGFSTRDSQLSQAPAAGAGQVRESTPSSHAMETEAPGSTSRPRCGRRQMPGRSVAVPPAGRLPETEIEDFFRAAEQRERQRFADRYNFDPVNDRPMPGRYEWICLQQQRRHD